MKTLSDKQRVRILKAAKAAGWPMDYTVTERTSKLVRDWHRKNEDTGRNKSGRAWWDFGRWELHGMGGVTVHFEANGGSAKEAEEAMFRTAAVLLGLRVKGFRP